MTKEEKEILLKYLCMAQPHGVICNDSRHGDSKITEIDIASKTVYCYDFDEYARTENVKPYLRPMSSMTEEEYDELEGLLKKDNFRLNEETAYIEIDWLLKNHFDFMGLIEKDLALDCTGLHIYD